MKKLLVVTVLVMLIIASIGLAHSTQQQHGCVGPHKGEQQEEVFFRVEALSDEAAAALAARYAAILLKHSGLDMQYSVSLQTFDGGFRAWTI